MNTANEQTKNSNNDFQNSNLTNSGSKKFTRDYDKEPIITKDRGDFILNIVILVLIFLCVILFFLKSNGIVSEWSTTSKHGNIGQNPLAFSIIFLAVLLWRILNNEATCIYFKDKKVEFYSRGRLESVIELEALRNNTHKPTHKAELTTAQAIFICILAGLLMIADLGYAIFLICCLVCIFTAPGIVFCAINYKNLNEFAKYRPFYFKTNIRTFVVLYVSKAEKYELKEYFMEKKLIPQRINILYLICYKFI